MTRLDRLSDVYTPDSYVRELCDYAQALRDKLHRLNPADEDVLCFDEWNAQ